MKYLVTGGCGFIGSNFMHYMTEKYPNDMFVCIDALTYAGNYNNIKSLEENGTISELKPFGVETLDTEERIKQFREGAYSFLSNGGICNDETVVNYNTAEDAFSQYNAAIGYGGLLQESETPEQAFKVITGKDITSRNITQDDIDKFNNYYGFKPNSAGQEVPYFGYITDDFEKHYITVEAQFNEETKEIIGNQS